MRTALAHAARIAAVSLGVALLGTAMVGPEGRPGVLFGAGVAFLFQVVAFWLLALRLYRDRLWIAYLLQMLGRFATFGLMAFLLVPAAGLPFAPTLLALVAVFFVTTLVEPVFMRGAVGGSPAS